MEVLFRVFIPLLWDAGKDVFLGPDQSDVEPCPGMVFHLFLVFLAWSLLWTSFSLTEKRRKLEIQKSVFLVVTV